MPKGGTKKTKKSFEKSEEKKKRVSLKVKVKQTEKKETVVGRNEDRAEKEDNDQLELVLPAVEKEKTILMWGGVIFFMAIIVVFWAFSFKNTIGSHNATSDKGSSTWDGISQIGEELDKNINSTKEQIDKMKFMLELQAKLQASSTPLTATTSNQEENISSSSTLQLSPEEIKNIGEELKQIKK
jgi:hypothetical protein